MEPSHRSIVPNIPGVPWWAAVLIAATATVVGYAFDAGHKELTHVFAGFYIAGCLVAVLAVRQSGVFTAVIQPPLILFFAVPGAYWLFHGGRVDKFKDLLINCGYPLIERFPLMLGTAGAVLLVGLVRWYLGMTQRSTAAAKAEDGTATASTRSAVLNKIVSKLSGLLAHDSDDTGDEAADAGSQPSHAIGRPSRSSRSTRSSRSASRRTDRTRSRHNRPPVDDPPDPTAERARRRRQAPRTDEAPEQLRRSRRPRPQVDPGQPPSEARRDPHTRRNPYERPMPRSSRFDPYRSYEPPESAGPAEPVNRYERRGARYEPYEPYQPPRRRTTPSGSTSANPAHHPIAQVRYRGATPRDEVREVPRDEPRSDRRIHSRPPRTPQPESWEFDV